MRSSNRELPKYTFFWIKHRHDCRQQYNRKKVSQGLLYTFFGLKIAMIADNDTIENKNIGVTGPFDTLKSQRVTRARSSIIFNGFRWFLVFLLVLIDFKYILVVFTYCLATSANLYAKLYIFGKVSARSFRKYIVLDTLETYKKTYGRIGFEVGPWSRCPQQQQY